MLFKVRLLCDIEVETRCRLIEGSSPEVGSGPTLVRFCNYVLFRAVISVLIFELKGLTATLLLILFKVLIEMGV